jgi:fluoride exporter
VNRRSSQADLNPAALLAQATLRLRSELRCERVIRLAHGRGVASATAYRGPEDGGSPIFVMLLDEADVLERFLPELRETVPGAPVSVIRESVEHVSPADFLGGGVLRPRPFRAEVGHLGWVFAGGTLGAGARLLIESAAASVSPFHDVFPWETMLVNVIGSFAIVVLGALLFERFVEKRERLFWVLGCLGSFTTFSSFTLQTTESWAVSPALGVLYGGGSILLGLVATVLGLRLARALI